MRVFNTEQFFHYQHTPNEEKVLLALIGGLWCMLGACNLNPLNMNFDEVVFHICQTSSWADYLLEFEWSSNRV